MSHCKVPLSLGEGALEILLLLLFITKLHNIYDKISILVPYVSTEPKLILHASSLYCGWLLHPAIMEECLRMDGLIDRCPDGPDPFPLFLFSLNLLLWHGEE